MARRPDTALALALALLAGCQELEGPSHVHDLRLLAVRAEPPEIILDPAAMPPVIPPIAITPLIADPEGGGRAATFTVRACGNDPLAPSAPGAGTEGAGGYPAGGARSTVGSARCPADGPTSWSVVAEPQAAGSTAMVTLSAEQVAAAFAGDLFPGHLGQPHGGFDLGLPISLELTVRAGDETVAGIKRVVFWPAPLRPDQRPNENPRIGEVRLFFGRDPVSLDPTGPLEPLAADAPRVVGADQEPWLEPSGVQAEAYVAPVIDRFTDQVKVQEVPAETLRYAYYATVGSFDPPETGSDVRFGGAGSRRPHIESRWRPPAAAELPADGGALAVTIWIVVRDERGGSSWVERHLLVQPATDP
jgi:hypothetical protein